MKFDSYVCSIRLGSVAARSQNYLYKAENLMVPGSDLDLMTTTAAKVVILLIIAEDQLDKELEDSQHEIHDRKRQRDSNKRWPARDPSHPALEEILAQGGKHMQPHPGPKKKAPRSYTGSEPSSFVADCIKEFAMA